MIHLRFDRNRKQYVDDVGNKAIEFHNVSFMDSQRRIDKNYYDCPLEQRVALEKEVMKILKELFPKNGLQPSAYALTDLGYFYTLDFLSAPKNLYASLVGAKEEAAK